MGTGGSEETGGSFIDPPRLTQNLPQRTQN